MAANVFARHRAVAEAFNAAAQSAEQPLLPYGCRPLAYLAPQFRHVRGRFLACGLHELLKQYSCRRPPTPGRRGGSGLPHVRHCNLPTRFSTVVGLCGRSSIITANSQGCRAAGGV